MGEALSPARADRCSDVDYKVNKRGFHHSQSLVSNRTTARTPDSATDDRSVPEDAVRCREATSPSSSPRDSWTPSQLPLNGERQVRDDSSDDKQRVSKESDDVTYEANNLHVASRDTLEAIDSDSHRQNCTADAQQHHQDEEESDENDGGGNERQQQPSPMAGTTGPTMSSVSSVEFWHGSGSRKRGLLHDEDIEDDDDVDAGSCDSPASVSSGQLRSPSPSHKLEIKTQRPLGLLAHHGLVSKASSSHQQQPTAGTDAVRPPLHQHELQHPATYIDYAVQYRNLLAARHLHKSGASRDLDLQASSPRSASPQSSMHQWTFEEQFKQVTYHCTFIFTQLS